MDNAQPIFSVTVLGHPPSVNSIWRKGRDRGGKVKFYKVKEYVDWETRIAMACTATACNHKGVGFWKAMKNHYYELFIEVGNETWKTKKGTPKKPDVTNFIKAAEDAVCKTFGWEDSYCMKCTIVKVIGPECTKIRFDFTQ